MVPPLAPASDATCWAAAGPRDVAKRRSRESNGEHHFRSSPLYSARARYARKRPGCLDAEVHASRSSSAFANSDRHRGEVSAVNPGPVNRGVMEPKWSGDLIRRALVAQSDGRLALPIGRLLIVVVHEAW
jgi:hypothetical protein